MGVGEVRDRSIVVFRPVAVSHVATNALVHACCFHFGVSNRGVLPEDLGALAAIARRP